MLDSLSFSERLVSAFARVQQLQENYHGHHAMILMPLFVRSKKASELQCDSYVYLARTASLASWDET